jgi:hypothetical protein
VDNLDKSDCTLPPNRGAGNCSERNSDPIRVPRGDFREKVMQERNDNPMCFRPADDLRRMLKEAAQRAHRSVNGEILHRLEQSFQAEGVHS